MYSNKTFLFSFFKPIKISTQIIYTQMESDKKWYLTRLCKFIEINRVFTELGTLLIDGDALIYHLVGYIDPSDTDQHELEVLSSKVENFLANLRERAFKSIKIVFFRVFSRFTCGYFNIEALFEWDHLLVFDG